MRQIFTRDKVCIMEPKEVTYLNTFLGTIMNYDNKQNNYPWVASYLLGLSKLSYTKSAVRLIFNKPIPNIF